MDELQQVNDIINKGITDSSYIAVIISSSVFIIYTLIKSLVDYFKTKNKDKPLLEMSKAMKEVGENVAKLNTVLSKTFEDAERKEIRQCDKAIQLGFKAMGFKIIQECSNIIAHNNIDKNKELIQSNITKLVSTEYYNLYSTLAAYEINEVNVSTKLKEEWITEIVDALISIIYDGQEAVIRIAHINDRTSILLNDYSTYVSNKIFNT